MSKISYSGKKALVAGAILPPYIKSAINKAKIQTRPMVSMPYTITLIYEYDTLIYIPTSKNKFNTGIKNM